MPHGYTPSVLNQLQAANSSHFLSGITYLFLCAFAKLRKATVICIVSVRLSACNISAPTGTEFHETSYLSIFRKSVEKMKVSLKSDDSDWYTK